ncbi:glycosyltransferase family 4 protein [Candidatus Microgenomates bacterium]|nr:glycosyltransferase family 4 protein [Candidatus Microgenomates bacterium]
MIIGIDGNEANIKSRVGVNKYAFEVLWGLYKLTGKLKKHKLIVYLKNEPLSDLPEESEYLKYKIIPGGGAWILTKLTPHLFKNPEKIKVLFSPSHYTPPILNIPRVCSIMDLGYLDSTGQFEKRVLWQLKYWTAISILASKNVLTISESTKKDIVRRYSFASNKTKVTLLGYDKDKFKENISKNEIKRAKNTYSIVGDYILYLGTLKPSKNIEKLVEAFSKLEKNSPELKLVIAGKKGWMYEKIYSRVEELKLKEKVVFTDFVEEKLKAGLIAGAKIFVLPSFWEGFGLDVVSSMAVGTPVVVSKVGSLPEVAGKAGVYVNPHDTDSIRAQIEKVLNMGELDYNKMVKAGFEQVKKFDWDKTAEKTLKAIEDCV